MVNRHCVPWCYLKNNKYTNDEEILIIVYLCMYIFQLKKTDKMEVLMDKFCQLKGIEKASARFYFDGEDLVPSDTSETLYLEGGECIDVHINE